MIKTIEVEWNYKGTTDRVLVLLPPLALTTGTAGAGGAGAAEALQHSQKTLQNLCSKETLKYIVVYMPFFDPRDYEQRCLFETYYGRELRLIPRLEKLLDRQFPDYLTSECVYMLAQPEEWNTTATPIEWYFDTILNEQLYQYYDATSRWLLFELKNYADHSIGAAWVYERVMAKIHFANDEDLVFVFGDLEPYECALYKDLLESYEDHHRLTAVYSYGSMTATLRDWNRNDDAYRVPFHLYTTSHLSQALYGELMDDLHEYSPAYTNTIWIGRFALALASSPEEEGISTVPLSRARTEVQFYDPRAWASLAPLEPKGHLTYEPLGLLEYTLRMEAD